MGLEDEIEGFFLEKYGYRAHIGGRGGSDTLFEEVAKLLITSGYPSETGLSPEERYNAAFNVLKTSLRQPETLSGRIARNYLLHESLDGVINSKLSGATKRVAAQWVVWLAEAEHRVAEKLPPSSERKFLEAAMSHWRMGGDKSRFGSDAFDSNLYHFNSGATGYSLFLVMGNASVGEKKEVLQDGLANLLKAMEPTGLYSRPFDFSVTHDYLARAAYHLILLNLSDGRTTVQDLSRLAEIADTHASWISRLAVGRIRLRPDADFTGITFAKGVVSYLQGDYTAARTAFAEGVSSLETAVKEFEKDKQFKRQREMDGLFHAVTTLLFGPVRLAERLDRLTSQKSDVEGGLNNEYLGGLVHDIKELDFWFRKEAKFRNPDYEFLPRWGGTDVQLTSPFAKAEVVTNVVGSENAAFKFIVEARAQYVGHAST